MDEEDHGGGGHDGAGGMRWLLTYADLITLLMAFFIVMYGMSKVDTEKYEALAQSLGQVFGGESYIGIVDEGIGRGGSPDQTFMSGPNKDYLENIARDLADYLDTEGLTDQVTLLLSEEGLNVRFTGSVLFDMGSANLRPDAMPVLQTIARYLEQNANYVGIAGSTDNLKLTSGGFPSNWELSVIRATNVVRYLTEKEKLDQRRFIALGYGEYHPLFANDTEAGRSKNRRIDLIIYRSPPFLGSGDVQQLITSKSN